MSLRAGNASPTVCVCYKWTLWRMATRLSETLGLPRHGINYRAELGEA